MDKKIPYINCQLFINTFIYVLIFILFINTSYSLPLDDFVITVKSDNIGSNSPTNFTILTEGFGYDYNVDCNDDGVIDGNAIHGNFTCDFALFNGPGTYTIRIIDNTGTQDGFPRIYLNYSDERFKLLTIEQWGVNKWKNMSQAFAGARYLQINAIDVPILSSVNDFSGMFRGARSVNPDTSNWNVSSATNLGSMFSGASLADPDTSTWNTSNVTDMSFMFSGASVANPNTSTWDTSNVTNMSFMFSGASLANPDTSSWDTSNVTNMSGMFDGALVANPDTSAWDTTNVTNMSSMFARAQSANPDTSSWNTSSVTNMRAMFWFNNAINPDTSLWNTSSVTNMIAMFRGASSANPNTSLWDTSSVTAMDEMFFSASSANPDTSSWDTSSVIRMTSMFNNAISANPDTSNWNTSKVTSFSFMFYNATNANPNTSNWDTSSAISMNNMFENAVSANPNVSQWGMQSVISVSNMFRGVTLTTANYDSLLMGWASQNLYQNLNFHGGNSKYCAVNAHEILTNSSIHNWNIQDGGIDICDEAAYNSLPLPGSNLNFSTVLELSTPPQLSLLINNDGQINSLLNGTCQISGGNQGEFSILSGNQFNIAATATSLPETLVIQCNTINPGLHTSTLVCSHNGGLNGANSPVIYPLACEVLAIPILPVLTNNWLLVLILGIGLIAIIKFRMAKKSM